MPDLKDALVPRSTFDVPICGLVIRATIDEYASKTEEARTAFRKGTRGFLMQMGLEWDLTDGGTPVPTDAEGLGGLSDPFVNAFFDALMDAALPKATATSPDDSPASTEAKTPLDSTTSTPAPSGSKT